MKTPEEWAKEIHRWLSFSVLTEEEEWAHLAEMVREIVAEAVGPLDKKLAIAAENEKQLRQRIKALVGK